MPHRLVPCMLVAGLAALPLAAHADAGVPAPVAPTCGAYDSLKAMLGERFGERPTSAGLADDGTIMQVFAAPDHDTWTIVSLAPDGMACVLATGRSWQEERAITTGDPA